MCVGSLFGISWSLPHDPSEKVHPTVAGGVPARGGLLDADMRTLRLLSPRDRSRPKAVTQGNAGSVRFVPQADTRPRLLDWVGEFQSCRGPVPWVELEVLAPSAGKTDPTVRAVAPSGTTHRRKASESLSSVAPRWPIAVPRGSRCVLRRNYRWWSLRFERQEGSARATARSLTKSC